MTLRPCLVLCSHNHGGRGSLGIGVAGSPMSRPLTSAVGYIISLTTRFQDSPFPPFFGPSCLHKQMSHGHCKVGRAGGNKRTEGRIFQIWCQLRTDKSPDYEMMGTMWSFCWGVQKLHGERKPRGRRRVPRGPSTCFMFYFCSIVIFGLSLRFLAHSSQTLAIS